jgi:hypothetical protein
VSRLPGAERDVLRRLAEYMLPGTEQLPPAAQLDIAERGLDDVLSLRGDLLPEIQRGLRAISGLEPGAALTRLSATDAVAAAAIRTAILASYYADESVRAALGYPGAQAHPYDPDSTPEYVTNGMLDEVIRRGPIWRRAD